MRKPKQHTMHWVAKTAGDHLKTACGRKVHDPFYRHATWFTFILSRDLRPCRTCCRIALKRGTLHWDGLDGIRTQQEDIQKLEGHVNSKEARHDR